MMRLVLLTIALASSIASAATTEIDLCGRVVARDSCLTFEQIGPPYRVYGIDSTAATLVGDTLRMVAVTEECGSRCGAAFLDSCITLFVSEPCSARDLGCGEITSTPVMGTSCCSWESEEFGTFLVGEFDCQGYSVGDSVHYVATVIDDVHPICLAGPRWIANATSFLCADAPTQVLQTTWGGMKVLYR